MIDLGFVDGLRYGYDEKADKVVQWIPAVRECIRPGPGRKFCTADYSQIELRIIAFLSQEDVWIDAIKAGKDLHCLMTSLVYPVSYEELDAVVVHKQKNHPKYQEWSALRAGIKCVNFGIPYGAGPQNVAGHIQEKDENGYVIESFEHALDRAKVLIRNYFGAAPKLEAWLKEQRLLASNEGWTKSVDGRKRFYDLPERDDPQRNQILSQIGRYAGNQPIQSTSADMLKHALRNLYLMHRGGSWTAPKILDANILLVCHDEILTDAADRDVPRAKHMLEIAMSEAYDRVSLTKIDAFGKPRTYRMRDICNEQELKSGLKVDAIVSDYWSKD
jgi:DNA polymerase-1